MNIHTPRFKIRLGLFITVGIALFVIAVFLIGRQKNLFNPVIRLTAIFHSVSGLQVGSNVRFSGIDVGTVDNITIQNDSTVQVGMLIRKNVQKFIKADCEAGIGSSGIIGDRILSITQGSMDAAIVKDGQQIASKEPIEMDTIMANLKETTDNAAIISKQVAETTTQINSGDGTLSRLIHDSVMAKNVNQTIINLRRSSKGLDENMDAAKDSFLLKGSFKRKAKAEQKIKNDAIEQKADEQKDVQKEKDAAQKVEDKAKKSRENRN